MFFDYVDGTYKDESDLPDFIIKLKEEEEEENRKYWQKQEEERDRIIQKRIEKEKENEIRLIRNYEIYLINCHDYELRSEYLKYQYRKLWKMDMIEEEAKRRKIDII